MMLLPASVVARDQYVLCFCLLSPGGHACSLPSSPFFLWQSICSLPASPGLLGLFGSLPLGPQSLLIS